MEKIRMDTPLVEMDGDEMTRVIWAMIKDILLKPFVNLKTEYYDLGLPSREASGDKVTHEAAMAVKRLGVGVKCAPNAQRMTEYNLTQMWKSPNGTIRAILDGTVFRTPIMVKGVVPYIPLGSSRSRSRGTPTATSTRTSRRTSAGARRRASSSAARTPSACSRSSTSPRRAEW